MRWGFAIVAVLVLGAACSPTSDEAIPPTPTSTSVASSPLPSSTTSTVVATSSTSTTGPISAHVELTYGARVDWIPRVDVVWHGLVGDVTSVSIEWSGSEQDPEVRDVDGKVAFQITKPGWTRYVTFTARDAAGNQVAMEEVLVDGGGCSARREYPNPRPNKTLPETIDEARVRLFELASRCLFVDLGAMAAKGGRFFGFNRVDLVAGLKELDRRQGIMREIRTALLSSGSEQTRADEPVHVFNTNGIEIVLDDDGRWIAANM